MNSEQNIHLLIIRLFSGEADNEEKREIETWINQSIENRELFNALKETWLSSGLEHNPDEYDVEEAIRQFREKVRFQTEKTSAKPKIYRLMRYAAILLLAATLPLSFYLGRKSIFSSESVTTITCATGDKTSVVLPDSSQVFLNSGSKLTFCNNFRKGSRQVSLDGEAYFTVKKDPKNPFLVKTSAITIKVLGTEFNLKAYSNEKTITTTLVSGSLKVTGDGQSAIIKPNQKLVYSKDEKAIDIQDITDLSPETGWKNGRLVFRNQSLGELELELERWFDVEIEFADEQVKNRRFTGTLGRESILEVISYFDQSKCVASRINDNVITFYTEK